MTVGMNKDMVSLLVDITEDLQKRIKHKAVDDQVSIKDLVSQILDKYVDDFKTQKDQDQQNIEKIMGKKK